MAVTAVRRTQYLCTVGGRPGVGSVSAAEPGTDNSEKQQCGHSALSGESAAALGQCR